MSKTFSLIGVTGFALALIMMPVSPWMVSAGGGMGGGATEVTQIANNAQLIGIYTKEVEQVANQLEQIENQIKQYQNMLERLRLQTENFKKYTIGQWTKAKGYITKIRNLVAKGQEIVFTMKNLDQEFLKRFPDYKKFLELKGVKDETFSIMYSDMSKTLRDTATSMLEGTKVQWEELETEESTIKALEDLNDDAEGMSQISQVGNMMANHQVRQLQKLRVLVMLQHQASATAIHKQEAEKDMKRAAKQRYVEDSSKDEESESGTQIHDKIKQKANVPN